MRAKQKTQTAAAQTAAADKPLSEFFASVPGFAEIFRKAEMDKQATQASSFSNGEREFIEVIIQSSESFELIQKSIGHVMRLVRAGADESRIITALKEIQGICDDSLETVACTGLSWND